MAFGKNKSEKIYEDDDNRTIVNMNVEGMPWYEKDRKRDLRAARRAERNARKAGNPELPTEKSHTDADELYGKDLRKYTVAATLTALLMVLVFSAAIALFVGLLCLVW